MPANPVFDPSAKTTLDENEGSDITALYRTAIGPVNTDYYLSVFERFETAGRAGPSWNTAACLSTLNWMVFRQIWTPALLYAAAFGGAALLLLGWGRLAGRFSDSTALCLLVALGTAAFMIPGVWGNAMLHRHVRKRMENALAATATVPEACALLSRRASSRQRMVWLALGNAALVGAVLGLYAAWPHTQRSGAVIGRVSQPAMVALGASAATAPVVHLSNAASERAPLASAPAHAPTAAVSATSAPTVPSLLPTPTATATATANPTSLPLPLPLPTIKVLAKKIPAKHFYINVGLFAEADNARNAQAKLAAAGLTPLTEELDTAKGKRTRVRVGPFDTKAAAKTVAGKIQALKLEAVVFRQ